MEEKVDKLDFIKIKHFFEKNIARRMKRYTLGKIFINTGLVEKLYSNTHQTLKM